MKVALLVHQQRPEATQVATELRAFLEDGGHDVIDEDGLAADGAVDLAVAIGGDGTILRTVSLAAPCGAPVLGVNVGQLGYLTEVEPSGAVDALRRIVAGDFGVEERMQVSVTLADGQRFDALNEAVVEKTPMGHTVRINVKLDGEFFTTYAADGLIIATPTGSTAYSFSARGPILDPLLRALVLTPVSPHMLFDRSMVVAPEVEVRLEVLDPRPATLSIDGRNIRELHPGDTIVCTSSPTAARLVTFAPRDFHRTLKTKFSLSDR